jgi:hypothetical protein
MPGSSRCSRGLFCLAPGQQSSLAAALVIRQVLLGEDRESGGQQGGWLAGIQAPVGPQARPRAPRGCGVGPRRGGGGQRHRPGQGGGQGRSSIQTSTAPTLPLR